MNGPGRGGSRWFGPPLVLSVTFVMVMVTMPATASAQLACDPCTVGLVFDGPWERNAEVRGIFEREVLDLVPLRFGGGPMYEPMAIATILGLIFATLLTLGVVPVLYSLFFRVSFKELVS